MANSTSDKKKALKMAIGGVQLQPAGHKIGEMFSPSPMKKRSDMIFPSISLTAKDAPGLKGIETGDEITIVARGCVVSHNVSDSQDNKSESFRIEFTHIGVVNPKTDTKKDETSQGEDY